MPRKRLSFKTDIAKRYLGGESGISIAASEGCTNPTIYRHLEWLGVQIRPSGGGLFQFKTDVVQRYHQGERSPQIAKDEGCCPPTVRSYLKKAGVQLVKGSPFIFKTDIKQRYLKGETATAIAKTEGCHQVTVCKALKGKEIELRTGYAGKAKKWSDYETELLRMLWNNLEFPLNRLPIVFNRTWSAIWIQARRKMKLMRRKKRMEYKKRICLICLEEFQPILGQGVKYCSKCRSEALLKNRQLSGRKYRLANKGRERERKQIWYRENKEKIQEHQKEYRRKVKLTRLVL